MKATEKLNSHLKDSKQKNCFIQLCFEAPKINILIKEGSIIIIRIIIIIGIS